MSGFDPKISYSVELLEGTTVHGAATVESMSHEQLVIRTP